MASSTSKDTMEGLNAYGLSEELANKRFYIKKVVTPTKGDSFIMSVESLIDKYYDIIVRDHTKEYTLTEKESIEYRYNPKRLSYDYFGTVELWGVILRINNISSVVDFNKTKIRLFKEGFVDILAEILSLENTEILTNNEELNTNNT